MFKKPWCNEQHQSYRIPPKTALTGMIAGILGISKKDYLSVLPPKSIKIGIEILKESDRELVGFNFMHGKKIGEKTKKFTNPYRSPTAKGALSPTRLEYLKDVSYRIYVYIENEDLFKQFFKLINENKFYFPPFLGQANLFAKISDVHLLNLNKDQFVRFIDTVVPGDLVDTDFLSNEIYRVEKIPNDFSPNREAPEYISIVFFEEIGKKIKIKENNGKKYLIGEVEFKDYKRGVVCY